MKLLSTALIALLMGCSGQPQQPRDSEWATCLHSEPDPAIVNRTGDPVITHGLLSQVDFAYEFRPCNKKSVYLVEGSFAVMDKLDQYFSTNSADPTSPIYVRFHGSVIECNQELPGRHANAVLIRELITHDNSVPLNCS